MCVTLGQGGGQGGRSARSEDCTTPPPASAWSSGSQCVHAAGGAAEATARSLCLRPAFLWKWARSLLALSFLGVLLMRGAPGSTFGGMGTWECV